MFDFPTTPKYGTNIQVPDGSWRAWDGVKWRTPLASAPVGPFLPLSGGTVTGMLNLTAGLSVSGNTGFNGTTPIARPAVSGAWAGNTAGKALAVALAAYGLITDNTTA
jgi:hypothetical protein